MPKIIKYLGMEFEHPIYGKYTVIRDYGLVHESKSGRMDRLLRVRFERSGYECDALPVAVTQFGVKDPYCPKIFGVGYFGEPVGFTKAIHRREYAVWYDILQRCYDPNCSEYSSYGGSGITVCERWFCFANFFYDFTHMDKYDLWKKYPRKYEMDKDLLQPNTPKHMMVYSPTTCCIIDKYYNTILKHKANAHNTSSEYAGVCMTSPGRYRSQLFINRKCVADAMFDDEYSAAVFHDTIAANRGLATVNGVPTDINSFIEACSHRTKTKEMCKIVNKP